MSIEDALDIIQKISPQAGAISIEDSLTAIADDSLDLIWQIQEIEKHIGAELPNDAIGRSSTVGDLVALMRGVSVA